MEVRIFQKLTREVHIFLVEVGKKWTFSEKAPGNIFNQTRSMMVSENLQKSHTIQFCWHTVVTRSWNVFFCTAQQNPFKLCFHRQIRCKLEVGLKLKYFALRNACYPNPLPTELLLIAYEYCNTSLYIMTQKCINQNTQTITLWATLHSMKWHSQVYKCYPPAYHPTTVYQLLHFVTSIYVTCMCHPTPACI